MSPEGVILISTVIKIITTFTLYSRRYPGKNEIFEHNIKFSWQIIIITLVAITLLSVIINRHKFSVKKITETILEITNLTISRSFPKSIKMSDYISRMVLGPVLLLFMFTSIQYCNFNLDNQVKNIPDKVIDSWDDLAQWKNVRIFGLYNKFMSQFVEQDNDMARNFKNRFIKISGAYWLSEEFHMEMAKNISTGNAVFVMNKLSLIFALMRMAQDVKDEDSEFLDHVHVSRHGSTDLPYFIPSFKNFDHPFHQDLNRM